MIFNTQEDLLNASVKLGDHISVSDQIEYELLFQLFKFPNVFNLPFLLKDKRESPDFLLKSEDRTIGIEVTYATNESWAEASSFLLSNSSIDSFNVISRNWFVDIQKKGKSLGNYLMNQNLHDWSWGSKEQAKEKAIDLLKTIQKKSNNFSNSTFEKFELNRLLIGDKTPFLFLDIVEFNTITQQSLTSLQIPFDRVFFITQKHSKDKDDKELILFEINNATIQI